MVTADSVKSKIRGLIDKSNAKTGHTDADLTTAVNTLIDGFGQGGASLPTLTNPGTASDMARGKQLIDANGNIVSGNLQEFTADSTNSLAGYLDPYIDLYTLTNGSAVVRTYARVGTDAILRSGALAHTRIPAEMFGDASVSDVAKGKTFTSENGVKVVGIREDDGGVTLPTLTNPASASDIAYGKQLIDSSGNVVTGNIKTNDPAEGTGGFAAITDPAIFLSYPGSGPTLNISAKVGRDILLRNGSRVVTRAPLTEFGDATAADVAAGKTFTSAAGHKVVGTMEPGGGFTVTDDGAGNVTITSSAITDNNGNVVIA